MQNLLEKLNANLELNNQLNYNLLMSNIINASNIAPEDKQILLLLLQNRDRNFVRINHNEECFNKIRSYLQFFRPLSLDKSKLVRIGGENDGGYVQNTDLSYERALSFKHLAFNSTSLEVA